MKRKYKVYCAAVFTYTGTGELCSSLYENIEEISNMWDYVGDTWAVSEKQAINNVRHREHGDYRSQLDWYWKAEEVA